MVFASKAFPCTAVMALFAPGGPRLRRRLRRASCTSRCAPASPPERLRAARQRPRRRELRTALAPPRRRHRDRQRRRHRAARALISAGALDDPVRERAPSAAGADPRHPRRAGDTHEKISTGQADSKFGFALDEAPARRSSAAGAVAGLELRGLHLHIGSQLLALEPFRARARRDRERSASSRSTTSAAASASLHRRAAAAARDRGLRRRARRGGRASTGADAAC